jgi:transcriptional regulator with XRE-family HTH domain
MSTIAYVLEDKMLAMADKYPFSEWLQSEMSKRNLSQADLAREAGVTRAAINGVLTGARGPGNELCVAIANAFRVPPETVFRAAGLLPPAPAYTEYQQQLVHLLDLLPEEKKQIAVDYIRFLVEMEEKKRRK